MFHLDIFVSFKVALRNAEEEILRLGAVQPWSCTFAGFYWANLRGREVRGMDEAGLAVRVPPCPTQGRGGDCGFSVMFEVQSSRSSFLRSRVEKVSEAGSWLRGKEHYQRFVMFDKE